MAMIRSGMLAACILLSACGLGNSNDPLSLVGQSISSTFSRSEPEQLTATRASLEAGGFDEPLLVATMQEPQFLKTGLLDRGRRDGVTFWRGLDGSTVQMDRGVVLRTIGAGYDLYSSQTDQTVAALRSGSTTPYQRSYRHLNPLNQLDVTRYFCEFAPPQAETITVFKRAHRTLRFVETCVAEESDAYGNTITVQNTFWKDANRPILWRSDQWISPQIGNILFERVFE